MGGEIFTQIAHKFCFKMNLRPQHFFLVTVYCTIGRRQRRRWEQARREQQQWTQRLRQCYLYKRKPMNTGELHTTDRPYRKFGRWLGIHENHKEVRLVAVRCGRTKKRVEHLSGSAVSDLVQQNSIEKKPRKIKDEIAYHTVYIVHKTFRHTWNLPEEVLK